jgi:hypothetical protein
MKKMTGIRGQLGLMAAGALALTAVQSVQAQSGDGTLSLTEAACSSAALAATIRPDAIGEPVGSVELDSLSWVAASGNSPAHCLVNGRIEPVDQSATARPIRFGVALGCQSKGVTVVQPRHTSTPLSMTLLFYSAK